MTQGLVRYDAACRALAAAVEVDEVKTIRDHAEAVRAYARQAKNKDLEVNAAEIRFRAERRLGELITSQRETVGLNKGSRLVGPSRTRQDDKPTLAAAGIDKHLADRARKLARVPAPEFEHLVGQWRSRVQEETERVTTTLIRAGAREQKKAELKVQPIPSGTFSVLYADPPWRYQHVKTESRAIENQYPTMALDEICALSVPAAPDAVVFLWATSPKLAEALQVLAAWGFTYRTCAVWDKGQIGMGYYFRQQHELLLVGTRGDLPVPSPATRPASVIQAPRQQHSAKPTIVYDLIEAMYPEYKKCELFLRGVPRDGWIGWGNEAA